MMRMAVLNENGEPTLVFKQGERLHIYCEFQMRQDINLPVINIEIRDKFNLLVHAKNTIQNHTPAPESVSRGDVIHYYQNITLGFAPGNYVINMECASVEKGKTIKSLKSSSLVKNENFDRVWRLGGAFAIAVLPAIGENLELLHGGLCDQPGSGVMQVISTGTL